MARTWNEATPIKRHLPVRILRAKLDSLAFEKRSGTIRLPLTGDKT
jgi:hypothetical protein